MPRSTRRFLDRLSRRAGYGLLVCGLAFSAATAASGPPASPISESRAEHTPSRDVRQLVAWVIEANDNQGLAFVIVDKINAEVLAFDRSGVLLGAAPALLGLGRGDDSPAGIGERPLSSISPAERITPAGRFVAARGSNLEGKDILWIDYGAGVSLHPVITGAVSDRRRSRLATPTPLDNRISYGCINVAPEFYDAVVRPLFNATVGIVYILPEMRPVEDVFPAVRSTRPPLRRDPQERS